MKFDDITKIHFSENSQYKMYFIDSFMNGKNEKTILK